MTMETQAPTFLEERRLVRSALARGIRPRQLVRPSEWAADHFMAPLGPMRGQKLDFSLTPYIAEILDCLAPDSPHTLVSVKKSAQTGVSTLALAWLFCLIDTSPDDMMYVMPTINAARDFNKERLDEAIRLCRRLAGVIRPQRSRSTEGSTTFNKKFAGGNLVLTGANSSADLASKTIRYAVGDEIDEWPLDLDGQGDPMELLDARQIAFTRTGSQKKLELSTPKRPKKSSRIHRAYEAGDQRRWVTPCPACGDGIEFRFDQLRFERAPPYNAHYVAQCCGGIVEAWQQRTMVTSGRWVAHRPGPGRHPSFFINSLTSLLTSWDKIAEKYWSSRGDPTQERAFANLWLGECYEEEGQELDAAKIAAAAEDYPRNVVPVSVGRTILTVDTQGDRLEWAVWGFGPAPTSIAVDQWLIAAGVIEGDLETDAPWKELDDLGMRRWPHAGGKSWPVDLAAIDSGGNHTSRVYRFGYRKSRWRVLKGSSNPDAIILGTPRRVDVKDRFGRVLFRVPLYLVGTRDLKFWLNRALKGIERDIPLSGGLHLTREIADEAYVRQLSAEFIVAHQRRDGFVDYRWEKERGQANEALDLAVYARACAFGAYPNGLAVDRMTLDQWSAILAERHDLDPAQMDLLSGLRMTPPPADGDKRASVADWARRMNG